MVLKIEYSQKINLPENPAYYYSRKELLKKLSELNNKRLILITAPAGYGKTSLSVEYFHSLKKDLKLWISISPYDNSIENFFLLLAIAFENNFKNSGFGKNLKDVLSKSQNISLKEKINNVISSFSNDLYKYLKLKKKRLNIFLDDFHNIDDSEEVCSALNYFLEYLPADINFIFITRRDPKKINYPKFLAKNWLGRISKEDLSFNVSDINNFLKAFNPKTELLDKNLLEEFLKTTEGWVTAIQLFLMADDKDLIKSGSYNFSRMEIFEYFTNEIYEDFSEDEKLLLLKLSFPESFDRNTIENVMKIKSGYAILQKLYDKNVFINREADIYRLHELLREFLNKAAYEILSEKEINVIYNQLGNHYLKGKEWREDYIALNYLIKGKDFGTLKNWIKLNASDKLLLIHSSGLYSKVEEIQDEEFKNSLEYILLKVNTLIYKDKNIEKAIGYLKNIIYTKLSGGSVKTFLIPVNKIREEDVNYYIELLMVICNCNFYKDGIGSANIKISEHILKFRLKTEQEIQFTVSLIKSYITTGENSKNKKYIERLKNIFNDISKNKRNGENEIEENNLVESIFSLLIFFDYGDYRTGNQVVKYILNIFEQKNFDLSNYSQLCFALFASYNLKEFENVFGFLERKNNEKNKTIFSAYKNQFEFQKILLKFLNYDFKTVVAELGILKENTFQKNYIYFIDSLILYCHNLLGDGAAVIKILNENKFSLSSTRKLILTLEASLMMNDYRLYQNTMKEIKSKKKENFTLFNQAVILLCESYVCLIRNDLREFKLHYLKFLKICEEYEFDNYVLFRSETNKLNMVFKYAFDNNIQNKYVKKLLPYNKISKNINAGSVRIKVDYLNGNRIYINNKELTDNLWQRPKSKSIFLYLVYKESSGIDVTKESIIDEVLFNSKDVNYDAIVDVELNKIRKTLQTFIAEIFDQNISKDILILKDKKYLLLSRNIKTEFKTDTDKFKNLCSSKVINEKYSAVEMYKTDFAEGIYQNWAEDIRENLKFIYSETIHKLISHYENINKTDKVKNLLERLADTDFNDDEIMIKLLSIYNCSKDYRKFKFMYKIYEKRLKKEFDVQPSVELKKFYNDVFPNS